MGSSDGNRERLSKVVIELEGEAYAAETVWAEPVGDGLHRLRNVLFFACGYSHQDVVTAIEVDGRLVVTGIANRAGHSTYRLILPEPTDEGTFASLWNPLGQLGCTYERASACRIGVDVPPEADIYAVYEVLEDGERAKQWTFEEGHCGHRLRE
jgi:hypothetical protein